MSCMGMGLRCEIKPIQDSGYTVKPLDKLFDLDVPSRIADESISEKTLRRRQYLKANLIKCRYRKTKSRVHTNRRCVRKDWRCFQDQVKLLQIDIQKLTGQSYVYKDQICQLQSSFRRVLHELRRDNEMWKMIHVQKVPIYSDSYVNDISHIKNKAAMADKIRSDMSADYLDTGDLFNGSLLRNSREAACKRRRRRFINHLISRYQGSVITVAKENNDLKSTFDVLSTVNVNLQKEISLLQNSVHRIDLSNPVEQPTRKIGSLQMPESVPCAATLALEVQHCSTKRSFMTPLPGFLNPVVNLECLDGVVT